MNIEKMMVLSTAHVTPETGKALDTCILPRPMIEWMGKLTVYPHGEYGWLICLTGPVSEDEEFRKQCPAELLDAIAFADDKGCEWLLLDNGADTTDQLPTFEW